MVAINEEKEFIQQPQNQPVEEENEEFDMKFPLQYHNKNPSNMKVIE
jgi:hypothetical protein